MKISFVFTHILTPYPMFFIPFDRSSFLPGIIFLPFGEIRINFWYSKFEFAGDKFLQLIFLERTLFLFPFWKLFFHGFIIAHGQFQSFTQAVPLLTGLTGSQWKVCFVTFCALYLMCLFTLTNFKVFSLSKAFINFIMNGIAVLFHVASACGSLFSLEGLFWSLLTTLSDQQGCSTM